MVENIQRLAARFVMRDFRRESSVTCLLNTLRWNTLQQRRLLFQAEMLHKIHHGIVNIQVPSAHYSSQVLFPPSSHPQTFIPSTEIQNRLLFVQLLLKIHRNLEHAPITHSDDNKYTEFQGSGPCLISSKWCRLPLCGLFSHNQQKMRLRSTLAPSTCK